MKFLQALRRIHRLLVKEFIQTLRDPHTRFTLFGPPIIQMLVFGYAATLEVNHVHFALLDHDNTQESREYIARLTGSPYFTLDKVAQRPRSCARASTAAPPCWPCRLIPAFPRTCAAGRARRCR